MDFKEVLSVNQPIKEFKTIPHELGILVHPCHSSTQMVEKG